MTIIANSLIARFADALESANALDFASRFISEGAAEDKRSPLERSGLVQRARYSADQLLGEQIEKIELQHPNVPGIVNRYWDEAEALIAKRWAERKRKSDERRRRAEELELERQIAQDLIAA
jgi:Asp-tRNA(Asn)/Glu-tRNA(Gln) amidotransferase A subunit family amidase